MVAWVRSKASLRSQTQASPEGLAAMRLTSRRRTGSASAFSRGATCSAWAADMAAPVASGVQQARPASLVIDSSFADIADHHNDELRIDKHRCPLPGSCKTSTNVDAYRPKGSPMSRVQLALRVAD